MAPRFFVAVLAFAALLFASPGRAESSSTASASAVVAATAVRSEPHSPARPIGEQPDAWKNPATGSTSRLFSQCAHVGEMILSVGRAQGWITVNLANHDRLRSEGRTADARITFVGPDAVRAPSPDETTSISLEPGWRQSVALVFPEKGDLRGASRVHVELPLRLGDGGACTITTDFDRYSPDPQPAAEYLEYSALDVYVGAGPRLLLTGGQDRIGSHEASIAFGVDVFQSIHHGFFFDIVLEPHGERGATAVLGRPPTVDPTVVTGGAFAAGYTFRVVFTNWLHASLSLGPALYFVDLLEKGESKEESVAFAVMDRLRLDAPFASLSDKSRFGFSAILYHLAPVSGHLGQVDIAGNSVGLLLGIVVAG